MIEVRRSDYAIAAYREDDLGLRNLAIISLTQSESRAAPAAALFSLTQCRCRGPRPVPPARLGRARPRAQASRLRAGQVRQARSWARPGVAHGESPASSQCPAPDHRP